ncbi:MAG: hypothetical protein IJS20_12440 [Bacteroidales bacterium]|nr:hypothetical protein [Bacteroidales bacterium]
MKAFLPILLALFLLTACVGGSEQMRHDLDALLQKNLSDSLLTDSTLAMALVDYFDSHGSQAERLEAHYLLARTWTDLGQTPRALDAFHTAAELADTTRLDSLSCHWLSRIYGQMGGLLYYNQIPYNAIAAYKKAYQMATWSGEQTVAASLYSQLYKCFYDLQMYNEAESCAMESVQMFLKNGDSLLANTVLGPLAYMKMRHADMEQVSNYLERYEYHSLLSKEGILLYEPWKLLYIYKGTYFQKSGNIDSALYYFHHAANVAQELDTRLVAYKCLYQAYEEICNTDSARKYAILYAQYNDSSNRWSTSSALLSISKLYDYNRMQSVAKQKSADAEKANHRTIVLSLLLITLAIGAFSLFVYIRKKNELRIQQINSQYVSDLLMYSKTKTELDTLNQKYTERWRKAETELEILRKNIREMQTDHKSPEQWELGDELLSLPIVLRLHKASLQVSGITDNAWEELYSVVHSFIPSFFDSLNAMNNKINLRDLQICVLTKLRFAPTEIANLLCMTPAAVSVRRKRLLLKIFGREGSASEFDEKIRELGTLWFGL